ncbi:hypothetical protein [Sphingomonas sp. MMS24-J13]|uniref:hypothetical protein n=1 Tax=Sphingomonas sp. MMS24-J13 TaxID=3238686 RepID=UPI00384C3FB4
MTAQRRSALLIRDGRVEQRLRRATLFIGILMSGGILLLPRLPLLAALTVLFVIVRGPAVLLRREVAGIWVLMLAVLAVALIGGDAINLVPTATRYANFVGGLMLLGLYLEKPISVFERDLGWMLRLFSIQALITVVLATFVSGLFRSYQFDLATYKSIFLIFTYHVTLDEPSVIQRPDGFFYEPGVLQFYLNIFLYLSLFRTKNYRDAALAGAAVLSTQSTTGVAIMIMLLGVAVLRGLRRAGTTEKLLVLIFAPLLLVPMLVIGYSNYVEKTEGSLRGSSWAREYDLYTGFRIVSSHPLAGIGFDPNHYLEVAQEYGYLESQLDMKNLSERGNTNGLVVLAYSVGIPLFLIFMIGLFRQGLFADTLIGVAIFIISQATESLTLTPFFLMIMFSGLLMRPLPRRVASTRPAFGQK